jgi:hypothetical protein
MTKTAIIIAIVAAISATLLAVPALAQDVGAQDRGLQDTVTTSQTRQQLQERIDHACERVPELTDRVQNALDRIQGDASTPGSLLWLQDKIQTATDHGRDELAAWFQSRYDIRTERIDVLELRLEWLTHAAETCAGR